MEFVDLIYCHRADPENPMEEVVWVMHNIIEKGYALFWGTSERSASQIMKAYTITEKRRLHKPIVELPQYNLFERHKVENEFVPVYEKWGMGLTTWSPLASGALTGKYLNNQIPEGSRLSQPNMAWLKEDVQLKSSADKVGQFVSFAKEPAVSPASLAIA